MGSTPPTPPTPPTAVQPTVYRSTFDKPSFQAAANLYKSNLDVANQAFGYLQQMGGTPSEINAQLKGIEMERASRAATANVLSEPSKYLSAVMDRGQGQGQSQGQSQPQGQSQKTWEQWLAEDSKQPGSSSQTPTPGSGTETESDPYKQARNVAQQRLSDAQANYAYAMQNINKNPARLTTDSSYNIADEWVNLGSSPKTS